MRCKRCGEDLEPEDFRRLRLQYTGVCKVCEAREKYEFEIRQRERRRESAYAGKRKLLHVART